MKTRFVSVLLTIILLAACFTLPRLKIFAESIKTGTLVTFGQYPQSEVKDKVTLNALNDQKLKWQSYGYFINGEPSDFMKYADVTYNGTKYRAVFFSEYRHRQYGYYTDSYVPNTVYWFKYEPITWRVLDAQSGLLISEYVLDLQTFQNYTYTDARGYVYGDKDLKHYASNWAYSTLRKWCNNDFYSIAFESEQKYILDTNLVTPSYAGREYDADPTTDKIFILSTDELRGMNNNSAGYDREYNYWHNQYTDYVVCKGDRSPSVCTRTPGYYGMYIGENQNVSNLFGIRPSVTVNIQSSYIDAVLKKGSLCLIDNHNWDDGQITTEPTCTKEGAKLYTCVECGATKVLVLTKIPHDFEAVISSATQKSPGFAYDRCKQCGGIFNYEILFYDEKPTEESTTRHHVSFDNPTTTAMYVPPAPITVATTVPATFTTTLKKTFDVNYDLGDVNEDKKVLADDARLALRASAKMVELTETQRLAADVNKDKQVLADDARQILRFSAKLQKEFETVSK